MPPVRHRGDGVVWSFYAAGESLGPLVRHRRDFRTGLVVLKLEDLLAAKHKPVSKWYPLGEKTQRSGGDGSRGSLQVIAQWRYNKDLDFEPFSAEDDVADREPNEVRVALFRGRGLAIKDKNILSKGGTSDPRVRFELLGGQFSDDKNERKKQEKERHFKSSVRKKTLDPVWREVFARELRRPKKDDQVEGKWSPPTLRCICEDVDKVGSADFMGCVDIALTPLLEKRETLAGWYALGPDPDGKSSSNVSGEIHVSVQWRFDAELDFDPWCVTQCDFRTFPNLGCVDGVVAMPHRLDALDVAVRESTRLVSERRQFRDAIVRRRCDEDGGDKPPNELRVALAKGRDLSVKDKPVLWGEGTSDPRVTFSLQVLGNDKADTPLKPWHSKPKKKTLNPTWNETYTYALPPPDEGQPGWVLTATCEDIDGMSSADFMGKVDIELQSLLEAPKRRSRSWHKLGAVDGKSSNVTGELDVIVQWRYNPALDFDPWCVPVALRHRREFNTRRLDEEKDPKHADKEPNELRIALVQGRSLAVKDKAVLYGAGSSDPRVRFKVTGTKDLHCASKCIKKSLDPSWRETFSLPLTKDYAEDEKPLDFGINGPILEVTCEDVDAVSSADFMGELNLPLNAVEKQRVRKWYPLEADAGGEHKSSNVHGELELILEWCYNPELDFDPFADEDKHPDKAPNEVCVGLGRGRHLAIKDKAVLYGEGSSDPRCTLRIDGTELKEVSQVKKTTLNPIWNETFAFPYSRGPDDSQPPSLIIECEDVDTITAADFMGLVRVELDPLKDHKRLKKWLPLQARSDDKASSNISGDLEVFVRWRYNPELDFDPYPDSELKPAYEDKAPNELRLALVQARGLAIKDKNLLSKGGF